MLVSHVNDLKDLRERAAEMRASSKELKDNNTATVILRLAELYDRLADRAEIRSNGGVLSYGLVQMRSVGLGCPVRCDARLVLTCAAPSGGLGAPKRQTKHRPA